MNTSPEDRRAWSTVIVGSVYVNRVDSGAAFAPM